MAVQNDKISEKRRRLFKALSAVPVVATLRPGSALAAQSSLQCAAHIRDTEILDPGPVAPGGGAPFVYDELTYWVLSEGELLPQGKPPTLDDLAGTGIDVSNGQTVTVVYVNSVNTDPADYGYYLLNGALFDTLFPGAESFQRVGDNLQILSATGGVLMDLGPNVGGFATVVRTMVDSDGVERELESISTYPLDQPEVGGAGKPGFGVGDPQGITGTCLNSFVEAGSGGSRGLTGG